MVRPMNGYPKTALVTGAGKRIGRAIALDLARHGWAVAVHYHASAADAAETVEGARRHGAQADAFQADLQSESQTAALIGRVNASLGPVTLLVNNASVFENDGAHTAGREIWDRHMAVNLRAPLVLTQVFASQLPADLEGTVINMLDQRVWNLTPYFTSYTVSKTALWTLTQTLALALAPHVRVNAIGPGPTLPSARQSDEQFMRQWLRLPLRRPVLPEEVAAAVRFIVDTPSMTGQMIALDGGQHLAWSQAQTAGTLDE